MAAIDKLYLKDYSDFLILRLWALKYFPGLRLAFYDFFENGAEFHRQKKTIAERNLDITRKEYIRVFGDPSMNNSMDYAIANIKKQYMDGAEYDCSDEQAKEEAEYIKKNYEKTYDDFYIEASVPVMNASLSQDRRLKWTCPIPAVREYLQNQCGVKKNREWLYRLFWLGKRTYGI